jgi:hypothetical protein
LSKPIRAISGDHTRHERSYAILNQISWLNYIRQPVLHNAG